MRLLILGGTAWLGSTIAADAVAAGHDVTCLARGAGIPSGAKLVRADRDVDDALSGVATEHWDAVVDVARQPGQLRRAVRDLERRTERFVFVSTVNVYRSQEATGQNEDAERLAPLATDVMASMEQYGAAKVACEDLVLAAFGTERSVIARAGLIGGPADPSGRTGYWPWRFAHPSTDDGTVLVPDAPQLPTGLIDVRDLSAWLVRCAAGAASGIFNAMGSPVAFPAHIEAAREVAGHGGAVLLAPQSWLQQNGVAEWSGERSMPLWLADRSWYGMNARQNQRAIAAGLTLRPLAETLRDTLAWELANETVGPRGAGLTDDDERALIARFARRGSRRIP